MDISKDIFLSNGFAVTFTVASNPRNANRIEASLEVQVKCFHSDDTGRRNFQKGWIFFKTYMIASRLMLTWKYKRNSYAGTGTCTNL